MLSKRRYSGGSTYEVHSLLVTLAMELHRSTDALLKEEQSHFQAVESRPEGPEEPSIF